MKFSNLFFIFATILLSCETTEDVGPLSPSLESELQELLEMSAIEPSEALSHVVTYSQDSDEIHSSMILIYPSVGGVAVQIIKDQHEDTIGIRLNYLENDLIQISHAFDYVGLQPKWRSTLEYIYGSEGKLKELFIESANRSRSLLARYIYNSQERLERIESPNENGAELQVYSYDENNRIASEWKSALGQEDSKIDFLVYEYIGDQLKAKKARERGISEGDFQDAFRYFYDQSGRLSKEEEFDPYFGFQQKRRTEYFYY